MECWSIYSDSHIASILAIGCHIICLFFLFLAILPQDDIHDVKRELENLGDLFYFKVRYVNIDDFVRTNLDLTPQERHALHWAHSSGYYEVPRQVHLEDVAAKVGLSKSALAEALRKAESKVITKWESEHMFLHGLFSK